MACSSSSSIRSLLQLASTAAVRPNVIGQLGQQSVRYGRRWLRPEMRGVYKSKMTQQNMKDYWRLSGLGLDSEQIKRVQAVPEEIRRLYQEAAPPMLDARYRNPIVESLHRDEMMRRRRVIDIPEFYAGSVLAVSVADNGAAGNVSRFVGMCVLRRHSGLFSTFTLRNQVDQVSVQIEYELYSPLLLSIQLLKLERRLDENLLYLMDAPSEYCSFPFDMVPVPHPKGEPAPLNVEKVKLNPPPWSCKWYLHGYQGIDYDNMYSQIDDETLSSVIKSSDSYKKYDLMDQYMNRFPLPDLDYAFKDIFIKHQELMRYKLSGADATAADADAKSRVIEKLAVS